MGASCLTIDPPRLWFPFSRVEPPVLLCGLLALFIFFSFLLSRQVQQPNANSVAQWKRTFIPIFRPICFFFCNMTDLWPTDSARFLFLLNVAGVLSCLMAFSHQVPDKYIVIILKTEWKQTLIISEKICSWVNANPASSSAGTRVWNSILGMCITNDQ